MGDEGKAGGRGDGDLTGAVRWVVIGVVAVVFLVLFRGPLTGFLERAEEIEVSADGVAIRSVKVDTPIGEAIVSRTTLPVAQAAPAGVRGSTYVNRRHGFQISWPAGGAWTPDEALGEALRVQMDLPPTIELPIFVTHPPIEGFSPNVNVVVEQIPSDMTIVQYMDATRSVLEQQGWTILSTTVDEDTGAGLTVFLNDTMGYELYQFNRAIVSGDRAFVVTASQLPPDDDLSQSLREELREILNSFTVIEG